MDIHTAIDKTGGYCQRKKIKDKKLVLCYSNFPGAMPNPFHTKSIHTLGDSLIV